MTVESSTSGKVFENAHQVHKYLRDECGYSVSYNTVAKALNASKPRVVRRRQGGGWTQISIDAYAKAAHLNSEVDPSPKGDVQPEQDIQDLQTLNSKNEAARLSKLKADKLQREMDIEAGLLTPTETIEWELAERLKGFKIGLVDFGHKRGEDVAQVFGADVRIAKELCRDLGIPETKAMSIVDFLLGRTRHFRRVWNGMIDEFLDAYGTGAWWTEEMRIAWEKFEEDSGDD